MGPLARHVPPVHSPLPLRAVFEGQRAAWGRSRATAAADEINEWLRRKYPDASVALFDSGTSALTVALRVAFTGATGPVVLPAFGCFDLATAVLGTGAKVDFYDLDPERLGPDEESLAAALGRAPSAVVVAHLYGVPIDPVPVRAAGASYGTVIVDDAAQGVGAAWNGQALGAAGDLGVVSFGRGKGTTGGGGGAVIVRENTDLAARLESARHGVIRAPLASVVAAVKGIGQWALARPTLYGLPTAVPMLGLGETHFRTPAEIGGIRADSLGVLAHTLRLEEDETRVRARHANRLTAAAGRRGIATPVLAPEATAGWLRLPVLVRPTERERWHSAAARRLGIMPSYPAPLPSLPALRGRLAAPSRSFPGATKLSAQLFTLPTHSLLAERDIEALERWILSD